MKCEYYYRFNNIGYKIAIPNGLWHSARYDPQHGNHRERQGERDKERHAVVAVELVDNHEHIDVAEWDEAKSKDAQGMIALLEHRRVFTAKEARYALGVNPHHEAGDYHCHGDETESLVDDGFESIFVALAHLDSAERLERLAGAREEKVIDLQQVHAQGENEDACATRGGKHNCVGAKQEQREADACQG